MQVTIITTCQATVRETWTATVPDEWTDEDIEEAFGTDDMAAEFVSEKADDETDREVSAIERDQ